ncbi:MAG: VCBS repeat-containing protein, partial [bacterium]
PKVSAIEVLPSNPFFINITDFSKVSDPGFGKGVALGDYDSDGDIDIFVVNALKTNNLFNNNSFGTFTNATKNAELGLPGGGEAAVWGDYDNDGNLDIYVVRNLIPNLLFHNDGDGTFTETALLAGVGHQGRGRAAAWGDYDNDGALDLFVANAGPNVLYHNSGDGTFKDLTRGSGVENLTWSSGATFGDYDNDGYLDLLVTYLDSTFSSSNILYHNNGNSTFTGMDLGINGFGSAFADYNNDGYLDIFIISMLNPFGVGKYHLYRNNGDGTLSDIAESVGLSSNVAGYGAAWGDFDNDGFLDLYIAHSRQPNQFYHYNGDGTFSEIADSAGVIDGNSAKAVSLGDFDNDGDLDIYLIQEGEKNILYQNQGTGNNWLTIKTIGIQSNKSGIGTRVKIVTANSVQIREVSGGSGFHAQNSLPLEFGLGTATSVDTIEIRWPSGTVDVYTRISAVNQVYEAVEGIALPVELISFFNKVEGNQVILQWTISNTVNFYGFQVERSLDGIHFQKVGFVPILNNSHQTRYYQWSAKALAPGIYYYRLKMLKADGTFEFSSVLEVNIGLPSDYALSQNYPNPFNQTTTIRYTLPKPDRVTIKIYNLLGHEVRTLVEMPKEAGYHAVDWDGKDKMATQVAAGIYFYIMKSSDFKDFKKLLLLR